MLIAVETNFALLVFGCEVGVLLDKGGEFGFGFGGLLAGGFGGGQGFGD